MPKEKSPLNYELAMFAVLAILVFLATYQYLSSQLREHDIRGVKFLSKGDPYIEMKGIFSGGHIVIKEVLYPGEDQRNSYVGVVGAEIAGVFPLFNKTVGAYGYVPEEINESERFILCTKDTNFCSGEDIIVQLHECNCVKIQDGKVQILFEADKLKEDALRLQLRGIIGGVLQGAEEGDDYE